VFRAIDGFFSISRSRCTARRSLVRANIYRWRCR